MIGTPAIRNLIRENKVAQMYSAIQTGQQHRHADPGPEPGRTGPAQYRFGSAEAKSKAANKDTFANV
jgi:twitching motility protein PilT